MTKARKQQEGFSLIELITSMAIGIGLLGIVVAVANTSTQLSFQIQDSLTDLQDAEFVLDLIEQDIQSISAPEPGRNTLSLIPEEIQGSPTQTQSLWLMLLGRPNFSSGHRGLRTVSYRNIYTDPMVPRGSAPRFTLFRTTIAPQPNSPNGFLSANELHEDYWKEKWITYIGEDSGQALLNDYLAERVIDLSATLKYSYKVSDTELKTDIISDFKNPIYLTEKGFLGDDIPPSHIPNRPQSITIDIIMLRIEGINTLLDGGTSWDDLKQRYGYTSSRTIPFLSFY